MNDRLTTNVGQLIYMICFLFPLRVQCKKMVQHCNTIGLCIYWQYIWQYQLKIYFRKYPAIGFTENHSYWLQHAVQLGIDGICM